MSRPSRKVRALAVAGACLVLTTGPAPRLARAQSAPLTEAERLAYARCLGELALLAPTAADSTLEGEGFLYPLVATGAPGSRLESSRSALRREREEGLTRSRRSPTAGQALAAAREYRQLGEYERAVTWYGEAAVLADGGDLAPLIRRETLATALAWGDSQQVAHAVVNTVGVAGLAGRETEIVLAYRGLLARDDLAALQLLSSKVDAQADSLPAQVAFWRVFTAAATSDWPAALAGLRALLVADDGKLALGRWERLWAAGALPDLLFLTGLRADASVLYRQLAASGLEPLAPWGRYQLAHADLLAGRLAPARDGFRALCSRDDSWPWRERACALSAVADSLVALQGAGADDDADKYAGR